MPYADKARQRQYQREWKARRRAEWFTDKACVFCDSTTNLELDHIDPLDKIDHKVWSWTKMRREAELAKCRALCKACHKQRSDEQLRAGTLTREHWYGKR